MSDTLSSAGKSAAANSNNNAAMMMMDASFDGAAKPPRNMTNVQVVVRCRPASVEERARGVHETVHCDTLANEVRVALNKAGEKVFNYDRVYDPMSTQKQIYEEVVEPLVQQTLRGYNTTVLAYGQTGTGKTHTMEGEIEDVNGMGVIPRAMQSIFRTMEARGDTESYVKASYLEIYNENLTDLLSASQGDVPPNQQLRIIEDKSKIGRGVVVHNLEEVLVKSWEDIRKVMKMAMSKRKIAATDLNERSSRSHAVFTVTVHSKEFSPEGEELLRVGKINLVDLAGSECVARSGSKDVRAREAGSINQSLLTLGRVITALVEKSPHIAYRDSKLTRLLQESLGGCSLTLMIATVAPSVGCLDETLSTLEYASRAKAIKNKPMANQKMSKRVAIREYVEEIERLRLELQAARAKDGVYLPEDEYNNLVSNGKSSSLRVQDLEALLEKRLVELNDLRASYSQTSAELKKTLVELDTEKDRLAQTKHDLKRRESELAEERKLCEERQAVIDAHVNVESRLHLVHDELQERLRNAKDRLHGLHEKIDRKQGVEKENEKLVVNLRGQVDKKLLEINQAVRDGKSVSFEGMSKVQEWLERFQKFVSEDVRQSNQTHRDRLMDFSNQFIDRSVSVSLKALETDQSRLKKEGTTNASGFADAAIGFTEGARSHDETLALARAAREMEAQSLRMDCVAPLIVEIERSRESANTFAESLLMATSSLQEATQDLVKAYEQRLASMEQEMFRMVREEKIRSKAATAKAAEKMSKILSVLQDDNENELDHMMSSFVEQKNQCVKEGQRNSTVLESTHSLIQMSNANWFSVENEQKSASLRELRKQDVSIDASSKISWENVADHSEETLAYLRRGSSDCSAAKVRVESFTDIVSSDMNERTKTMQLDVASTRASLTDLHRIAIQEDRVMDERSASLLVQAKKDVDTVRSHTDRFCETSIAMLDESKDIVDAFTLKEDRPTGRTPSRLQVLDWTKERPQTSPHSRIVDRVRKSRNTLSGGVADIEDSYSSSSRKLFQQANTANKSAIAISRPSLGGLTERDSNVVQQVGSEDEAQVETMKIQELRSALKEKGLSVKGDKTVLKERLRRASTGGELVAEEH